MATKYLASVTPYAGLKASCRHITSQDAVVDKIRFVIGSAVVGKTNQIQIISYDDMQGTIQCVQTLEHLNEIRWITCHPTDAKLIFTISSDLSTRKTSTSLYKIPDPDPIKSMTTQELQKLVLLNTFETEGKATRVFYVPNDPTKCIISTPKSIDLFDIEKPGKPIYSHVFEDTTAPILATCPDPLHQNIMAACCGHAIKLWDMRQNSIVHEIPEAHAPNVLDVSFNENKPWWICSGGSDGAMRCWDVRVGKVECEFRASSHWVTRVVPSTSHEQLIITAGTDSKVRIFNALKFAFQSEGKLPDGEIIKSIRHDDSVYCAAWAASNPWVFASVSYKGQVNVCQLPSEVVDAILMGDDTDSD
jgi:WD40 repeat protein